MAILDWNKQILTTTFSIIIFPFHEEILLPFPQVPNLTRHTFHKSIKPKLQTENLASKSRKQFYVILNTSQIKLYAYPDLLRENPVLRKFLNSESIAYLLDETFYHTDVPLLSITISAAKVIKVTKYYIIHNSYNVATKYSIITETCKIIVPGWNCW